MEIIIKEMAKREGVNEALKASDQLEWIRRMNNIHNRAEEMVLSELVYDGRPAFTQNRNNQTDWPQALD